MTNADQIRQMSDVELANYLDSIQFIGCLHGKKNTRPIHADVHEWFEWLKEEVKDG